MRDAISAGLLLVGHGTRSQVGQAEMRRLGEQVAALLPEVPVESCFLELAEPAIAAGVAQLAAAGVRRLQVAPLLLFAAGHAKRDIPDAIEQAASVGRDMGITYAPHFGCQPDLIELSAERFAEAVEATGIPLTETALVLVGRGSLDREATAEMHQFAELRAARTPVGSVATCFLAMAEPRLSATLAAVAEQGWRRIVVQPHLLFHGDLLDRLQAEVAAARVRWPDREWLAAERLGPAPQLASLIARRFRGFQSPSKHFG